MSPPATQAQKEYLRKWCTAHPEKVAAYSKTERAKATRRLRDQRREKTPEQERKEKEYHHQRYLRRREALLAYNKTPEGRAKRQAWEDANRTHQNQKSFEWRAAHPEKAEEIAHRWKSAHGPYVRPAKCRPRKSETRIRWSQTKSQVPTKRRERFPALVEESRKLIHELHLAREAARLAAKDRQRVLNREWARNPKRREYSKQWRHTNRMKCCLYSHNRRARVYAAPGHASEAQIFARVEYYGHQCAYCGGPFEALDHVIPISRGGSNWPANFRPACTPCNGSKGNQPLAEFLRRRRVVQQAA